MKAPHYFIHGNLVFGSDADDGWAAYKLDGHSYPGMSLSRKLELKERLEGFVYAVESDFQIIRTPRRWSADRYLDRALGTLDPRRGHRDRYHAYLEAQRRALGSRVVVRPETYLFVRLSGAAAAELSSARLTEMWRGLERRLGLRGALGLGAKELAELRRAEERAHALVFDYLPCDRACGSEVMGLIRSAYGRGLGELAVDPNWAPQALYVEGLEGEEARFQPYRHDLLRLHESRLEISARSLRIETEAGVSHQAICVVGALPDEAQFPGPDVELLFSPFDAGLEVEISLSGEYLSSKAAQKLAQRRMVDADQAAKEESAGEHGASIRSSQATYDARELQARLGGSDRPPLIRTAITIAVGAASEQALEEQVDRLRAELGRISLHRPLGDQHRLFLAAMPAQRFPLAEYKAHLLPEQLGAMVPTAIAHAGSEIGPYLGYTLGGGRQPIQLDLAEASRSGRPPTMLLTGSLGSGKTIALEALIYQAFLQGSGPIVDIDPKGDHRLERLPGMAGNIEEIELGPDERYRGLLDPMRIATADRREDLTYNFLFSILPEPVPADWQTEIRAAVGVAAAAGAQSSGEVLAELERGSSAAGEAARALRVHLGSGLAKLGHASAETPLPEAGSSQVISLRIRNLTLPLPGTRRSELQEDERVSQAVLRLLAAYALRLCAADQRTHSVLALDEAWALLADSQGKALLSQLSRMGRSMNITTLLASQIVGDASELEPLIGTYLAFGVETAAEARAALELLRLEADDEGLRQRLLGYRSGRCYLRDLEGRVVSMRVDPGAEILAALDTTPHAEEPDGEEAEPPEDEGDEARDAAAA